MRPPFPSVFDSTILAAIRSCHMKAYLEFMEHWKGREPSVHLHAGAAFAAGLEAARKAFHQEGKPEEESIQLGLKTLMEFYGDFECPSDSAKSLERTAGAYEFYCARYPLSQDDPILLPGGKRGVELSFAEPIDLKHPETGEPLIYCGRADQLVNKFDGIFGDDDKTTSQLGASWPRQWDLRSQFTGYSWGFKRSLNLDVKGWLVRGVSILKTKYDTLEAVTYRPAWQIERWYDQTLRDITKFMADWEQGVYDMNLDHACNEYGGCQFRQACLLQDPQQWLDQFFERREWNPITREERLITALVEKTPF